MILYCMLTLYNYSRFFIKKRANSEEIRLGCLETIFSVDYSFENRQFTMLYYSNGNVLGTLSRLSRFHVPFSMENRTMNVIKLFITVT